MTRQKEKKEDLLLSFHNDDSTSVSACDSKVFIEGEFTTNNQVDTAFASRYMSFNDTCHGAFIRDRNGLISQLCGLNNQFLRVGCPF